jgi:hypothetical protein
MGGHDSVFEFEKDFAGAFQCIPMAVRYKLDLSGVKLSLNQWKRFTEDDRRDLLARQCETAPETTQFREQLAALITTRAGEAPKFLAVEPAPAWENRDAVPNQVIAFARSLDIKPPTLAQWQSLSILQRFTLLKLSRERHDNVNFIPALKEFKLLPAIPAPSSNPKDSPARREVPACR